MNGHHLFVKLSLLKSCMSHWFLQRSGEPVGGGKEEGGSKTADPIKCPAKLPRLSDICSYWRSWAGPLSGNDMI